VEPTHGPGHDYVAINRRNIGRLRDDRDRAGLIQLADILSGRSGSLPAQMLADEARAAAAWIDDTTPRTYDVDDADGIRIGDVLRYARSGCVLEGVVIAIHGHTVTTNLGDHVAT